MILRVISTLFLLAHIQIFGKEETISPVVQIKEKISAHFPKAFVKTEGFDHDKQVLESKIDTMTYDVHRINKAGEVSEKSYKEEGPKSRGFIISIYDCKGKYEGATAVPQTLKSPYWNTFINVIYKKDGTGYYWVTFSFGSRVNDKFKEEILKLLKFNTNN